MEKQEYLEMLSKMEGWDLLDELLFRKRLVNDEFNTNGIETEKYLYLVHMYFTCRNYIADRLDKRK